MPASARSRIVQRGQVQVFHCWARCVRRAYLCGNDPLTGKDYSHRRDWVHRMLEELAGLFAIEVGFHCEMQNHVHVMLRTRPDVVRRWPKEKVVRCWLKIAKLKRGSDDFDWEPPAERVQLEMKDPKRVKRLRRRLANVSWWMGALFEHVARRANREDGCRGAFVEQRFSLRLLTDEPGILVCGIYIDLNVIRAGEALTPETSRYTSAYDRIQGRKQRRRRRGASGKRSRASRWDRWLCELMLREGPRASAEPGRGSVTRWRASDKGLLPIALDVYLQLLDWTGRQIRRDKRGSIPVHLAPILERLQVNSDVWLTTIEQYETRFGQVIGRVEQLARAAAAMGLRSLKGITSAAESFK